MVVGLGQGTTGTDGDGKIRDVSILRMPPVTDRVGFDALVGGRNLGLEPGVSHAS